MGYSLGIVGLANVGKSTLFNALTHAGVASSNYPFCTIKPNVGIVEVPDADLERLYQLVEGQTIKRAAVKVVDLAGLIKGSHRGEGLGNQFLAELRPVSALIHLVRCFRSPEVSHIEAELDPVRDIEIVQLELILSDLEIVSRRLEKDKRLLKARAASEKKELEAQIHLLENIKGYLARGHKPDIDQFNPEQKKWVESFQLIVTRPVIYVANIDENQLNKNDDQLIERMHSWVENQGFDFIPVCAKLEQELSELSQSERSEFIREIGLENSALNKVIEMSLRALGLIVFYTIEVGKVQAWPVPAGTTAWEASGYVHSDMQRGFIKAEVIAFEQIMKAGSLQKIRESGLSRIEGKDYQLKNRDIVSFRFSV